MRIQLGFAIVMVVVASTPAMAGPTYKPTLKYQSSSGSGKQYDTPEAACADSVAGLAKMGNKQTFVKVAPGSSDKSDTCILRDSSNHQWPQKDSITIYPKCQGGSDATSGDNSGTLASEVCPCDPVKGCPVTPPADACTTSPSDIVGTCDVGPRCTQQPAAKKSVADAKKQSDANAAAASKDTTLASKYDAAKAEIQKEQFKDKTKLYGSKLATNGFPEFAASDLYQDGPSDVNIGKLCGHDDGDFAAANNVAGYGKTPAGYTWHHNEDLGRFQLVKTEVHAAWESRHWGGRSIWKRAFGVDYPKCCPKKK